MRWNLVALFVFLISFSHGTATFTNNSCPLSSIPDSGGGFNNFFFSKVNSLRIAYCVNLEVPLNWNSSESESIAVFAKSYLSKNVTATSNLFVFGGEPGDSLLAAELDLIPYLLNNLENTTAVHFIEFRGTGFSTPLSSPYNGIVERSKYLSDTFGNQYLQQFTITNIAKDVIAMINLLRGSKISENWIYGFSFGSIVMNRILQVGAPNISAIALDGVGPLDPFYYQDFDADINEIGMRFLQGCDNSNYCNMQMNGNSRQRLFEIYRSFSCIPQGLPIKVFRHMITSIFMDPKLRSLVGPLIKRVNRCNVDDKVVLSNFFSQFSNTFSSVLLRQDNPYKSFSAFYQFVISELFVPGAVSPVGYYQDLTKNLYFSLDLAAEIANGWEGWAGRYTPDSYWKFVPFIDQKFFRIPIIFFGGALDAINNPKYTENIAAEYGKRYFPFKKTGHITLLQSYVKDQPTCAFQIIHAFFYNNNSFHSLQNQTFPCLNQVADVDFDCLRKECLTNALVYFNTTNAWGVVNPTPRFGPEDRVDYYVKIDPFNGQYVLPEPSTGNPPNSASSLSRMGMMAGLFFIVMLSIL